MRVLTSFVLLGLSLLMLQCKTSQSSGEGKKDLRILYVAAQRIDCIGVGPQTCYQIRLSPEEAWKLYYGEIEGFDYEPGYEYKIKVNKLVITNPPADAAGFRYQLVEVMDKKAPDWMGLHDIWSLQSMKGKTIELDQRPYMELFPGQEKVQGFAGCNQFFGKVKATGESIRFQELGSTKMFCSDKMEVENELLTSLRAVDNYMIKDLQLILFAGKQQLMVFRKVD